MKKRTEGRGMSVQIPMQLPIHEKRLIQRAAKTVIQRTRNHSLDCCELWDELLKVERRGGVELV